VKTIWIGIIVTSMFASKAFANFSGNWKGQGLAWNNRGWQHPCEKAEISMTHTETKLTINSAYLRCGELVRNWPKVEIEIVIGELILDGQSLGHISDSELHASRRLHWGTQDWDLLIKDGSLNFVETDHLAGSDFVVVRSSLTKE
jgi:hypothetical protein